MDTVHECDRQTDRQTDGQTDRITITDTVQRIASHGKNHAVAGKPSDAAVNFKRYKVCTPIFVSLVLLMTVDVAAKIEYNK